MMTIAGTASATIAILAVALECPLAAAVFGATAYWLVAHA
jgi:hypothetical protein